jgi:hypothetical protein
MTLSEEMREMKMIICAWYETVEGSSDDSSFISFSFFFFHPTFTLHMPQCFGTVNFKLNCGVNHNPSLSPRCLTFKASNKLETILMENPIK